MPDKVIVCLGDSADDGSPGAGGLWPVQLRTRLSRASEATYRVIDAEAPGLTVPEALKRFENQVVFHRPHLVTLRFGSTDSRGEGSTPATPLGDYEAGLRALAQLIRERTSAIIVFITTPPASSLPRGEDPTRPYHDVTRRVAYELNAPLLDLHARFERPGAPVDRWADSAFAFLKRLL